MPSVDHHSLYGVLNLDIRFEGILSATNKTSSDDIKDIYFVTDHSFYLMIHFYQLDLLFLRYSLIYLLYIFNLLPLVALP